MASAMFLFRQGANPVVTKRFYATVQQTLASIRDPVQKSLMSEKCILVDESDNIIGSDSKLNCHLVRQGELKLHRAFSVFLFDLEDKLLMQARSDHKVTFPKLWTNTCCSHPLYVDDEKDGVDGVKRAALRRLNFELGITELEEQDLQFLTRIHYKSLSDDKWGEHEMDYILFARKNVRVSVNDNEIREIKYATMTDVQSMDKITLTPWFRLITETKLFTWWSSLANIKKCQDINGIMRF